jgi:hypothetical protein
VPPAGTFKAKATSISTHLPLLRVLQQFEVADLDGNLLQRVERQVQFLEVLQLVEMPGEVDQQVVRGVYHAQVLRKKTHGTGRGAARGTGRGDEAG